MCPVTASLGSHWQEVHAHTSHTLPLTHLGRSLSAGQALDVTEAAAPPRGTEAVERGPRLGTATPVLTRLKAAPVYQGLQGKPTVSARSDPQKSLPRFSPRVPSRPPAQDPRQAPPPGHPSRHSPQNPLPSDPTHLTLSASEALWTGADEARVGGRADAPVQTGPGEAGVGLLLAVRASVARAAKTAERVHSVQAGPAVEAGAGGKAGVGQAPPPWRPRPPPGALPSLECIYLDPYPLPPARRDCSPVLSLSPNLPGTSALRWEPRGGPPLVWSHPLRDQHL